MTAGILWIPQTLREGGSEEWLGGYIAERKLRDIALTEEQLQALNTSSALEAVHPYTGFTGAGQRGIFGGAAVEGWSA